MARRTYISIITLNVNGIKAPTKRHRLAEWIQKEDPHICCLQETHFSSRDTYKLKVRGWKKIIHANGNQKKAGVAILILDKIDFKMKNILRDKAGHYIMIKGSIQEEDRTILNIYAPKTGSLQYIRQLQTKNLQFMHKQIRKINSNTTLKIVIKPEEERTREEGKKKIATKTNPKQLIKWQ